MTKKHRKCLGLKRFASANYSEAVGELPIPSKFKKSNYQTIPKVSQ